MTRIRLLREAEDELLFAVQRYEEAQAGLGQAMVDEVRRAKALIAAHPRASRIERKVRLSLSLLKAPVDAVIRPTVP